MKYPHITAKLVQEPWLITARKHWALMDVLEQRLAATGGRPEIDMGMDPAVEPDPDDDYDSYRQIGNTAIIPVHGILGKRLGLFEMICGGCDVNTVSDMLDVAESDWSVSKIILDINSPGGTVTGIPELGDQIAELTNRKNVVAFCDVECCSGGLWLASCAEAFYCAGSATTGSCGVRMILLDESARIKQAGVQVNPIFSGKYKLAGASFKPLEDDERAIFQAQCDRIHADFKAAVLSNHQVDDQFLQGQLFSGDEAEQIGLTDGVCADLEDLLDLLNG